MARKYTLVPLKKKELQNVGIPLAPQTLYKWHAMDKYPEIFVKIGGKLFIIVENFDKLVEKQLRSRLKRQKRGLKLYAMCTLLLSFLAISLFPSVLA